MNRLGVVDDTELFWPHHLVLWAAVLDAAAGDGYRLARTARPDVPECVVLHELIAGLPGDIADAVADRWPALGREPMGPREVGAVLGFLRARATELRVLAAEMAASTAGVSW